MVQWQNVFDVNYWIHTWWHVSTRVTWPNLTAKTQNSGRSQNTRYINKISTLWIIYHQKGLNEEIPKPNYVISILSQDISEILLKCPKCYITILTQSVSNDTDRQRVSITSASTLIMKQQLRTSMCTDNRQCDMRPTPTFGASMRTRD